MKQNMTGGAAACLRRLEGVVRRKVYVQEKDAALVWRACTANSHLSYCWPQPELSHWQVVLWRVRCLLVQYSSMTPSMSCWTSAVTEAPRC